MINLNRERLYDKIRGCWRGKSMGSTLGARFEGMVITLDVTEPAPGTPADPYDPVEWMRFIDATNGQADPHHPEKNPVKKVNGFLIEPGEIVPNDDLDLQLVWLMAVDDLGIENINSQTLGEYWLDFIDPFWNEYGRCKVNLREGLLPPLSGEFRNGTWKNSNGAWLRTEVWACLLPGQPDEAARMALVDACVDHGYGEGTFAACFIAAMESAAFITDDLRTLVEIGLSKIPNECAVARYVRDALEGYDSGANYRDVRNRIYARAHAEGIGTFQAPNNVAFIVLGLLYGEGDFKKTLLTTINCTDDTDCTAATVGAIFGAMYGESCIPEDWKSYVSDALKSISLMEGSVDFPKTVTEVIDKIIRILPRTVRLPSFSIMGTTRWYRECDLVRIHEAPDDFGDFDPKELAQRSAYIDYALKHSGKSMHFDTLHAEIWLEYERDPVIRQGETLKGRVSIRLKLSPSQKCYHMEWHLPDGWQVIGTRNVGVMQDWWYDRVIRAYREETFAFEIIPGERIEALNRLTLALYPTARALPIFLPVSVLG